MLTLVAYKAFADAAAKGAMLLVTIAAARRLAPEAFGVFAIGATAGWLAALVSDFGLQVYVARRAAASEGEPRAVLRRWLPVRLISAAVAAALLGLFVSGWNVGGTHRNALLLFAFTYLLSGLSEFLSFYLRGIGRTDVESTITLLARTLLLGSALTALWTIGTVTALGAVMFAVATLTVAASAAAAWRSTPRRGDAEESRQTETVAAGRLHEAAHHVLPLGIASVLAALYFRIDVLLLEAWQGTEAAGLYNAVFRIVEALRLVPAAVLAVAMPVLFRAADARAVVRVASYLTAFAGAASTALWVLADWLVPWTFGLAYSEAVPAFRVLLLAFPLMALNYALTHQVIGWNRHGAYALLCAVALAVNLALNTRLVPQLSILGAAWATLVTEGVLTSGCLAVLFNHRAAQRRTLTPQVQPS